MDLGLTMEQSQGPHFAAAIFEHDKSNQINLGTLWERGWRPRQGVDDDGGGIVDEVNAVA